MRQLVVFFASSILLIGCSSQTKKEIAYQERHMSAPQDRAEMIERMQETLNKSNKLSQKQKDDFLALQLEMSEKMQDLNAKMRKDKVILFQHMANETYDENKVRVLRKRITKLNNNKLKMMFNAMKRAKDILGVELKNFGPEWLDRAAR